MTVEEAMGSNPEYDVVIVGGGVGGLIVGSLLSQREKKRVLILEKSERAGGRLIHFHGDDIREPDDYLKPLAGVTGWLDHCEPDMNTIIKDKLLHGYSIDAGWHAVLGGPKSRICHILQALGKPIADRIVPYGGFAYWDEGKLYKMTGKAPLPWMNEDDLKQLRTMAGVMVRMTTAEARSLNHVTLMEWLDGKITSRRALAFYDLMGAFLIGLNSGSEVSAGEYILIVRSLMLSGLNLPANSAATAFEPGLCQIAQYLADVFLSEGGVIRYNTKANAVRVENGTARGVVVEGGEGNEEIKAKIIVCDVPLRAAVSSGLLPNQYLPSEFTQKVKGYKSVGAFCPTFGLSRKVLDVPGMHVTRFHPDKKNFPEGILFGYVSNSLLVKEKAPEGKQLIETWIGFSTQDIKRYRKSGLSRKIIDMAIDFMKKNHPGFEDALEWILCPGIEHVLSVAPTAEQAWDRMPDPKCPGIENLFLVGDTIRNWGQYTDGTSHAALQCVSSITGKDYLELLPEYLR